MRSGAMIKAFECYPLFLFFFVFTSTPNFQHWSRWPTKNLENIQTQFNLTRSMSPIFWCSSHTSRKKNKRWKNSRCLEIRNDVHHCLFIAIDAIHRKSIIDWMVSCSLRRKKKISLWRHCLPEINPLVRHNPSTRMAKNEANPKTAIKDKKGWHNSLEKICMSHCIRWEKRFHAIYSVQLIEICGNESQNDCNVDDVNRMDNICSMHSHFRCQPMVFLAKKTNRKRRQS